MPPGLAFLWALCLLSCSGACSLSPPFPSVISSSKSAAQEEQHLRPQISPMARSASLGAIWETATRTQQVKDVFPQAKALTWREHRPHKPPALTTLPLAHPTRGTEEDKTMPMHPRLHEERPLVVCTYFPAPLIACWQPWWGCLVNPRYWATCLAERKHLHSSLAPCVRK